MALLAVASVRVGECVVCGVQCVTVYVPWGASPLKVASDSIRCRQRGCQQAICGFGGLALAFYSAVVHVQMTDSFS